MAAEVRLPAADLAGGFGRVDAYWRAHTAIDKPDGDVDGTDDGRTKA